MSRLGKKPIEIPEKVDAKLTDGFLVVKGPKGQLDLNINPKVKVNLEDKQITISVDNPEEKQQKALWGLFSSLIRNMVIGVTQGFEKKLEVIGVGYKVDLSGNKLTLNVGYSHPCVYDLPEGISAEVDKNIITIKGIDKQLVGEVAAQIRKFRKPEPYKGKGIRYVDEYVRRKAGKALKGATAA